MPIEVFEPSSGPLAIPSVMYGHASNPDVYRKDTRIQTRPHTQGGSRFGQLSINAFFTRHNPHPNRVRHIKGLLDAPICAVNDNGFFASPKYDLHFPPNNHDAKKVSVWKNSIPVNAINVNSQRLPLDTISGLQNFTGLQNYSHREKAIPEIGAVPMTERWREELYQLVNAVKQVENMPERQDPDPARLKTQYSETTGRLIPPPSRAMSRQVSRRGKPFPNLDYMATQEPDLENTVFTMLCQILQTDDTNAVQAWLCNAPEMEKQKMMELIRSALKGREDYYVQHTAQYVPSERPHTSMPAITETALERESSSHNVNRLVLDDGVPSVGNMDNIQDIDPRPWARPMASPEMDKEDVLLKPQVSHAFKMSRSPTTVQIQENSDSAIRLRYTQTPKRDESTEMALKNMGLSEWVPEKSVCA